MECVSVSPVSLPLCQCVTSPFDMDTIYMFVCCVFMLCSCVCIRIKTSTIATTCVCVCRIWNFYFPEWTCAATSQTNYGWANARFQLIRQTFERNKIVLDDLADDDFIRDIYFVSRFDLTLKKIISIRRYRQI